VPLVLEISEMKAIGLRRGKKPLKFRLIASKAFPNSPLLYKQGRICKTIFENLLCLTNVEKAGQGGRNVDAQPPPPSGEALVLIVFRR